MRTDYEQLADRYDEDRARFTVEADDIVVALGETTGPGQRRVLDVGCGTGTWLWAHGELVVGADVCLIGADPSAAMLEQARRKGLRNLVRCGAEALPFVTGSVDYAVANFTFHHWEKEQALREVTRVLTPRGVFRVTNVEPGSVGGWWLYDFFPEAAALDEQRFWSSDRIANELEHLGFHVQVYREVGQEEEPIGQALADAERRVVSQLAALDDEAYFRGLTKLRDAAKNPDTTVTNSWALLRLTASRR